MGREWVSGLKPAKNVGANTASVIECLVSEVEGQELPKVAEFETQVIGYKAKKSLENPQGVKEPEKTSFSVTNYSKDPKVKAWVLKVADGCGRYLDNIFIERLWRSLKQEAVCLHKLQNGFQARQIIDSWIRFYNSERPHTAFEKQTPNYVYFDPIRVSQAA